MIVEYMKKTDTYKESKKKIDKEFKNFCCDNMTITIIVAIILTIVFCFHGVKPIFNWVSEPQETFGWISLAVIADCFAICLVFFISLFIGDIINTICAWIYYRIKLENTISTVDVYNKIEREYRQHADEIFRKFITYTKDEYFLGEKPALRYSRK